MDGTLDKAARYLQKLQGDALWERTAEPQRERYRVQVRTVLQMVKEGGAVVDTATANGTYCATCDSYTCSHATAGN
jgi:hypothetical protein